MYSEKCVSADTKSAKLKDQNQFIASYRVESQTGINSPSTKLKIMLKCYEILQTN